MRLIGIPFLCMALVVTGCSTGDSSFSDQLGDSIGDSISDGLGTAMVIGVLVVGGAAIHKSADMSRDRYRFTPNLNVRAPKDAERDRVFDVWVAVADEKANPQKQWWDGDRAPDITIVAADGASTATLVKAEVRNEWHIARYRASEPGMYKLTVKASVPGPDAASAQAMAEATRDILVK